MSDLKPTVSHFQPHATLSAYITGFVSCIVITLVAYVVATSNSVSNDAAVGIVAGLAILQFVTQLIFFLHLGREFKPRWKMLVFWLMITIVLILVGGSIWIMNNLNYRMMQNPSLENKYIQSQDGL